MCGDERTFGRRDPEDAEVPGSLPSLRNELGGTVLGPSIQARDIRGDIYLHPGATRLPPPSQLPPPVRLIGRADDLEVLDAARPSRVIVITGPPGIGKSALAVSWGHAVRQEFPDGVFFEDLHAYAPDGPGSPSQTLGRFIRALGVPAQQVPAELAELTAIYRSLLADRRVLVMLDDAFTAAQVMPLLPPSPGSVAVVTSRLRLGGLAAGGARIVQLGRLSLEAALDLLGQTLGDDRALADPNGARELVDLCAGVPLAVCVAGARLAARSRWPISEMTAALAQERRRLAALEMEDDMAVRSALDVSYQALDPEVARMYRLMGLFPGTRFDSAVAAATADVSRAEARRSLGLLTDANLLDDAEGGAYRYHDLTRLHAQEMAALEESEADRRLAIRRMIDWFLSTVIAAGQGVMPYRGDQVHDVRYRPAEPMGFTDRVAALDWLDGQLPQVTAVIRLAVAEDMPILGWQLADVMWPLFLHRGRYAERLAFDQLGLEAARSSGDLAGEAKMLGRLSLAALDLRHLDEAEAYARAAMSAWQGLGNDVRVAGSLRRLALVCAARKQPADAISFFAQALDVYRRLRNGRQTGLTLSDIGAMLIAMRRPADAISSLQEAALLLEGTDAYNLARVQIRLGQAHDDMADFSVAARYLGNARQSMRAIGSPRGEVEALMSLGQLAEHAGQPEQAGQHYRDALTIVVSLGSPQEPLIRERLAQLG